MKQFILSEETAKGEFELLKSIWIEFKDSPNGLLNGFEIVTNKGVFENFGGFNGNPFDLWLRKKGTKGQIKNTFWRVGLGNNKQFKLFVHDLRFEKRYSFDVEEMAKKNGCKLTSGYLRYFIFDDGEPLTTKETILTFVNANKQMVIDSIKELELLKKQENKEVWQVKANALVQKVCNNDFRALNWKEIYTLIRKSTQHETNF